MKVLKAPEDVKTWSTQCTCATCKAELEIEVSDIHAEYHSSCDPREPGDWWTYFVICEICKLPISLSEKTFSDYVKHVIQKKAKSLCRYTER